MYDIALFPCGYFFAKIVQDDFGGAGLSCFCLRKSMSDYGVELCRRHFISCARIVWNPSIRFSMCERCFCCHLITPYVYSIMHFCPIYNKFIYSAVPAMDVPQVTAGNDSKTVDVRDRCRR